MEIYEKNKKHLGFFPRGAFEPYIERNEILVARDGTNVLGYLMFRYSRGKQTVRVTHLCVDSNQRGKGIAVELLAALKERYARAIRITARCRNDFDSWEFWKIKSDFLAGRELAGKKKSGSTLTEFYWEPSELPLFKDLLEGDDPGEDDLPLVVLDANVFYDIYDHARSRHREASGLREDWLSQELDLCVTTELSVDAGRATEAETQVDFRNNMEGWKVIAAEPEQVLKHTKVIKSILGNSDCPRSVSDRRHLAIALSNDATAFVTRDGELLENSNEFFEKTGLSLCRPSDLIVEFDILQNNDKFQFREVERTGLRIQRYDGQQGLNFSDFRATANDKVAPIRAAWHDAVSNPSEFDTNTVIDNSGKVLAIAISTREAEHKSVSLVRIRLKDIDRRLGKTLVRYLLANQIGVFGPSRSLTLNGFPAYLLGSLQEFGFFLNQKSATKYSLPEALPPSQFLNRLRGFVELEVMSQEEFDSIDNKLQQALGCDDVGAILELEHRFAPLKLQVDFVPNYIVPIQPRWAKDLFDSGLCRNELWDAPWEKILNPSSVYYKGVRGFSREINKCRIIWYVSGDKKFPLAKSCRGSSIMTRRVTGKPHDLFKRYRRLGIYEYHNVRDIPSSAEGNCEAIEFGSTETWSQSISHSKTMEVLRQFNVSTNNFVTAQRIPSGAFFELHRIATSHQE